MPIHEFRCPNGHVTERTFLTFGAVEELETYIIVDAESGAENHTKCIDCPECDNLAVMLMSVPLPAHFYGKPDGYHKPSPTQRESYKKAKLGAVGNDWSAG